MKFKEAFEAARLRAGAMLRERKERAEVRKMERQANVRRDTHHNSRFWLLNVPAAATICAATVEWYWAVLFCIAATGKIGIDWATAMGSAEAATGSWHFDFSIRDVAVLIGLILATMPIVMLSMIWLPVQFAMRGAGRWRRGTLIVVGLLANVLVIVSGTVVMNMNRQEQVREGMVVEQAADANRAMLASNVQDLKDELAALMNHRSTYVATAASVGLAAYQRDYASDAAIAAERDPTRRGLLTRARGAAARADELRAQIAAARQTAATAAPTAATQANVEDNVGAGLNTFAQYVAVYRPPFVAFICTLIGIFGAWWVVALLDGLNPRDVIRSGWADEGHRIEDKREEGPLPVDPAGMRPPREVVTDAETGEELIRIQPKPHWRKRKGKPQQVETWPDIPPDERGVEQDGGARIGSALPKVVADNDVSGVLGASENQTHVTDAEVQPEQEARDADERAESYPEQQLEHAEPPIEEPTEDEAAAALHELELIATPVETPAEASDEPQEERPEDDRTEQDDDGDQQDEPEEQVAPRALLPAK